MKSEKSRPYQICTRCVMDTTDSKITFDEKGVCDHCRNFDKNIKPFYPLQKTITGSPRYLKK